mmetsp:Transcript_31148/g.51933  ORF Transcript_31148/g.51933 Transcript_31148/m.51933 type:complete len:133 (-) Transcript_31148:445-843(-)
MFGGGFYARQSKIVAADIQEYGIIITTKGRMENAPLLDVVGASDVSSVGSLVAGAMVPTVVSWTASVVGGILAEGDAVGYGARLPPWESTTVQFPPSGTKTKVLPLPVKFPVMQVQAESQLAVLPFVQLKSW